MLPNAGKPAKIKAADQEAGRTVSPVRCPQTTGNWFSWRFWEETIATPADFIRQICRRIAIGNITNEPVRSGRLWLRLR
jgi:hypothetical protein